MFNFITIGVKPPADFLLYCDNKIAYASFYKTETKPDLIRFKGDDLPTVANPNIAVFENEIKQEFLFKEIFQQKIKVPAPNENIKIAFVELPEMVYINQQKKAQSLPKYIILEKQDEYFTAALIIPGLKPRFQKKLIENLIDKKVMVRFYQDYYFHPLSRKDYLDAVD